MLQHIMDFCKYEAAVQMKRLKTVLGHVGIIASYLLDTIDITP